MSHSTNDMPHTHHPELPPDLAAVSAALDDLAADEQSAAPAGLSDRVYFRTAKALRAQPAPSPRRVIVPSALRIAAVLALTALGVIAISQRTQHTPADSEASVAALEQLFPVADETWNPITSDALASMQSELDALESDLDLFWSLDSHWLDEVAEESL